MFPVFAVFPVFPKFGAHMSDELSAIKAVRETLVRAMESRRELVAYSKMEAVEMDRRAREVERDALEQVRAVVPDAPVTDQLHQIKTRLARMDEKLDELAQRQDIQERSRALERDDIIWRAFEDVSWLLGVG